MRYKDGVHLGGMTHATVVALFECDGIFRDCKIEMLVTSANDSHSGPLHCNPDGSCEAFDLRLPSRILASQRGEPWDEAVSDFDANIFGAIKGAVGSQFDVILESHQKNPWRWHIHVEHDPKEG